MGLVAMQPSVDHLYSMLKEVFTRNEAAILTTRFPTMFNLTQRRFQIMSHLFLITRDLKEITKMLYF